MADQQPSEDGTKAVVLAPDSLPEALRVQILKALQNHDGNTAATVTVRTVEQTVFSGPVPPPELLAAYERIETGLASRLVAMSEKNGGHIRWMEKLALLGRIFETFVGQLFALTALGAFLYGGIHLSMNGHPVAGVLTSSTALLGVVTVFIKGRQGAPKASPQAQPLPGEKTRKTNQPRRSGRGGGQK